MMGRELAPLQPGQTGGVPERGFAAAAVGHGRLPEGRGTPPYRNEEKGSTSEFSLTRLLGGTREGRTHE